MFPTLGSDKFRTFSISNCFFLSASRIGLQIFPLNLGHSTLVSWQTEPFTPMGLAQFFTVQMKAEGRGADRFARPEEIDILAGTF